MSEDEQEYEFDRDISEDVKVNRFKLDVANEAQASIFNYWSTELSNIRKLADKLETRLKVKKAKVAASLRVDPPGGRKLTESAITELVTINPDVQAIQHEYNIAKGHQYDCETAVNSMEQRKTSINNLVKLYATGYFQVTGGMGVASPEPMDSAETDARDRLNRNRRARRPGGDGEEIPAY